MSLFTDLMARRHGGMAQAYERMAAPLEAAGFADVRARLAGEMRGRTIEVGCGTGLNFRHYGAAAEVVAVEPLPAFGAFATERARRCGGRIAVLRADAQALPFADASFDGALVTLALCSIPDARRALAELRRVLRLGAPLRCFEHVRSPRRAGALLQDLANPLWRWLLDGCNLNRDTLAAVHAAGFAVDAVREHDIRAAGAPRLPLREIRAVRCA